MIEPLVIAGSGGLAREAAETVRACNAVAPRWNLLGFLDDNSALHGSSVARLPVIGPIAAAAIPADARVLLATGRPTDYASRARIVRRLGIENERYATVVHPAASLAADTEIGFGSVVLAGAVATAGVRIGHHVAVMPHVTLTHDCVVDDFATICSRVALGGGVRVERGAYLGAGCLVRENLTIGEWSLVGMGSVLTRDVPPREIWYGAPARFVRPAEVSAPPDELRRAG